MAHALQQAVRVSHGLREQLREELALHELRGGEGGLSQPRVFQGLPQEVRRL